jgi:perosamine synthetase
MIRITEVRLNEEAERLVSMVLRSGHLAQGPMVASLEREFAGIAGTTHAVATSSGTSALVACLQALALGPGDEVITTPFTFVATLNAILEAGATVRLVDIDPISFTIDPEQVASTITPATKAIIPVHLYGYPADMDRLERVAHNAGVTLIEDAAQAHGARIDSRSVGSWGMGVFSFYATKSITTGEGGMITTNDDMVADRLRLLRNQGMRARYDYEVVGHNYRMTDVQAAIGLSQLPLLEEWTNRRRSNASILTESLRGTQGIDLPVETGTRRHAFHQFTIRVRDNASLDRNGLAAALRDRGVETGIYYPRAAHDYECFRRHPLVIPSDVPQALRAAREVLSLPVHQWLSTGDLERIAESVKSSLGSGS